MQKNTGRVRPEDLRGLKAFRREYPEARAIYLHRGRVQLRSQEILCLPLEPFLRHLLPGRPLDRATVVD